MTVRRSIPWTQITIEAVAIVASILLAFSIDAWWEDRQKRAVERQLLNNLLVEFERIEKDHEDDRNGTLAVRETVLELLRQTTREAPDVSAEALDRLLADSLWSALVSNYTAPVLNSTISGGDLTLITNPVLRQDLGAWGERFRDIADYISRDTDFMFGQQVPFIRENGSLLQVINATECRPGVPDVCWSYGEKIDVAEHIDHRALLVNPRFQGLLAERLLSLTDLIGLSFSTRNSELDETIALIREQIDSLQ